MHKANFNFIVLVKLNYKSSGNSKEDMLSGNKEVFEVLEKARQLVSDSLNISLANVSARNGTYVDNLDERFETVLDYSPMNNFYKYAKELPNENDLKFLKTLENSGFAKKNFDKKQLDRAIGEIEDKLKK